jgi:ABC-type sulfate transport system permease component
MDNAQIAILIGLVSAVVLGFFTARSSARREAIHGGPLAELFHFIGAAGVTGILPMVLASLILRQGFELAFPLALSFMGTSLIALVLFAIVEMPAREAAEAQAAAQGWTEEKARTSGL